VLENAREDQEADEDQQDDIGRRVQQREACERRLQVRHASDGSTMPQVHCTSINAVRSKIGCSLQDCAILDARQAGRNETADDEDLPLQSMSNFFAMLPSVEAVQRGNNQLDCTHTLSGPCCRGLVERRRSCSLRVHWQQGQTSASGTMPAGCGRFVGHTNSPQRVSEQLNWLNVLGAAL